MKVPAGKLTAFIKAKIANYVPPSREGVPRGQRIGMSREKYAAACWRLTNLSWPKIATLAGTTHAAVRQFALDETFKKTAAALVAEYAAEYVRHLLRLAGTVGVLQLRRFRKTEGRPDVTVLDVWLEDPDVLADASLYGDEILELLELVERDYLAVLTQPGKPKEAGGLTAEELTAALSEFCVLVYRIRRAAAGATGPTLPEYTRKALRFATAQIEENTPEARHAALLVLRDLVHIYDKEHAAKARTTPRGRGRHRPRGRRWA